MLMKVLNTKINMGLQGGLKKFPIIIDDNTKNAIDEDA